MSVFNDPRGDALFNTWAPRLLWTWAPGASLALVLLTDWIGLLQWLAQIALLVHAGALAWIHRAALARAWAFVAAQWRRWRGGYASAQEMAAHEAKARETAVELNLIAEAGRQNSDEARVYLGDARTAMTDKLERLLTVPKRTRAQERERVQLEAWLEADLRRSQVLTTGPAPQPFLAPASPRIGGFFMRAVASWHLWVMGALAALAGTLWARGEALEAQRDRARAEAELHAASLAEYGAALAEERAAHARDMATVLEETARTVQQLQERQARAERLAQRERARDETLTRGPVVDFSDQLRELAEPAGVQLPPAGAEPPGGDSAGGLPIAARPDPEF